MKLHIYSDGKRISQPFFGLHVCPPFGMVFVVSDDYLPLKFVLSNAIV